VLKEKPGFPLRSAAGMTLYDGLLLEIGKRKIGPVGPQKKGEQAWRFMI